MAARLDAKATIRNTPVNHYSECNTYLIDGKPFYDAPDVLPFYSRSVYSLQLDFVGFHGSTVITPGNYRSKGYSLEVLTRWGAQPPRKLAITQNNGLPSFSLSTGDPAGGDTQIEVNLYQGGKSVANARLPFEVVPLPDPSVAITTYLPFYYLLQEATLQITDRGNTNNQISADITFGGTVALQEGKEYIMMVLMEKSFQAGSKELTLSINAKEDYGHRVEFEWQGPALPLKLRTENGMYAYLTAATPSNVATTVPDNQVRMIESPATKERAAVATEPRVMERARVTETAKVTAPTEKPQAPLEVRTPVATNQPYHISRPINADQIRQVERSALQQALRRNPGLLEVKPVAPEISQLEAEAATTTADNTYTLLIHLFNEFGEEDSNPKEVKFVILK